MSHTPLRILPSPEAIGDYVAALLLPRFERVRLTGRRFLLGCPTGRTPRPVFGAIAQQLADAPQDISHVELVMMDEYLVPDAGGLTYVPADEPWSCHRYVRSEIAERLNETLPARCRLRDESVWFPDPRDPPAYDDMIAAAGGIDFFLLASGASDGHVAFNPPGSPRASRTRIIPLSDETRRDNLQTFPAFGTVSRVPRHGISVGIDTIASAREAVMVVWGAGKRLTLTRMRHADRYDAEWPATVIHECAVREILSDRDAAGEGAF